MKRGKSVALMFVTILLALTLTVGLRLDHVWGAPETWTVDDDGAADFRSIREALDAASDWDTIFVYNGTYSGHLEVNKSVVLQGESWEGTIIRGEAEDPVINVSSDSVQIRSFTIECAGNLSTGIRLEKSSSCTVENNLVKGSFFIGILLHEGEAYNILGNRVEEAVEGIIISVSPQCNVSGNTVYGCQSGLSLLDAGPCFLRENNLTDNRQNFKVTGVEVGDFIHDIDSSNTINGKPIRYIASQSNKHVTGEAGFVGVVNSTAIVVEDVKVSDNMWGILVAYSANTTILNSASSGNSHGVRMLRSSGCTVRGCSFTLNTFFSIASSSCADSSIVDSSISDGQDGVYLQNCRNMKIRGNLVSNNTIGVRFEHTHHSTVDRNLLEENGQALVFQHSTGNLILHNTFQDNFMDVQSRNSSNSFDEGVEGNFWSTYNGADANKDGIGDNPHEANVQSVDYHPLKGRFSIFETLPGRAVTLISNSTITSIIYLNNTITLHVENGSSSQTHGFLRICIPHALMGLDNKTNIQVAIDGGQTEPLDFNSEVRDNGTHRWIYFAYQHSTREIVITFTEAEDRALKGFVEYWWLITPAAAAAALAGAVYFLKRRSRLHTREVERS